MSRVESPRTARHVSYEMVRDEMRTGDVLLFMGKTGISSFVRRFTKSPYSHAALVARWEDRVLAFNSTWPRLELVPASKIVCKYEGKVVWFGLRRLPTFDERKLVDTGLDLLRMKYSLAGLLRFGWAVASGKRRKRPESTGVRNSYFCSEFVSACFRASGQDLDPFHPDYLTAPGDLAQSPHLERRGVLHHPRHARMCDELLGARTAAAPAI